MSEASLPIQLRHRELHGNLPQLFANLEYLHELSAENYNGKHDERISDILLWITTKHPEVLKDEGKLLSNISITNLCFRDSYEKIDKLIPTETLALLLKSKVCKNLMRLCGYMDPKFLDNKDLINNNSMIKIAVGKHNIELFKWREFNNYRSDEITFHLRCRELSKKDLQCFPVQPACDEKIIYISNVSDRDVAWVLMAAKALNKQNFDQDCTIKFKQSELTTDGLEEIAQGLSALAIMEEFNDSETTWSLGVSSPHIGQTVDAVSGYEESRELYLDRISFQYGMEIFSFTEKEYEEEFLCERLQMTM